MFPVNALDRTRGTSVVKPPTEKEMAELNSVACSLVNPNCSVEFDPRSGFWLVGFRQRRFIGLSYLQSLYELTDMG
jgi:hypothetical protein